MVIAFETGTLVIALILVFASGYIMGRKKRKK